MITASPPADEFPPLLAELALDFFALVQRWRQPPNVRGPARGRLLEEIFVRYCTLRHLPLVERAGAVTLNGGRAASGFRHEVDGVIRTGGVLVHVELKNLGQPLTKNELLVFNQKGIDFLYAHDSALRQQPLYRAVVSAGPLAEAARNFAIQWGIIVIEPNRLPLPALYASVQRANSAALFSPVQRSTIRTEIPLLIAPLQRRLARLVEVMALNAPVLLGLRVERALRLLQEEYGAAGQRLLAPELDARFIYLSDRLKLPYPTAPRPITSVLGGQLDAVGVRELTASNRS